MSWLDLTIVLTVLAGIFFGAQRGVLRQVALMSGFYVSMVLAAQYYSQAAGVVVTHLPGADRALASAYTLAALTIAGTLMFGWLSHAVYAATGLPRVAAMDRLGGAGLGAAWSWAVLAFALTVLLYGLNFNWGANEVLRRDMAEQMRRSQLVGLLRGTLPVLRDLLLPWLPGGLPAPLVR